jgi:hypothetical protein
MKMQRCVTCEDETDYIFCEKKQEKHALCGPCLLGYVESLLNSSDFNQLESLFPIRCCLPECKASLPRDFLFNQLKTQVDGEELITMIEQAELKVAMLSIQNSDDVVISCPKCAYFEIFDLSYPQVPRFFICKMCIEPVAVCIKCKEFVEYSEVSKHDCSQGFEFWKFRVQKALIEANVRRCPDCGKAGRLDLNCTHVTCSCGIRWCYCCQKREADIEGGFYEHNQWSVDRNEAGKCPMYLRYKYGSGPSMSGFRMHQVLHGDEEEALSKFHEELKIEELAKLEAELNDPEMWARLMQTFQF